MGLAENRPEEGDPRARRARKSARRSFRRDQLEFELEFFADLLDRDPCHVAVLRAHARNLSILGRYQRALPLDRRLTRLRPDRPVVWYNLACTFARLGRIEAAFETLDHALKLGYRRLRRLVSDPDLRPLRDDPRFQRILRDAMRAVPRRAAG